MDLKIKKYLWIHSPFSSPLSRNSSLWVIVLLNHHGTWLEHGTHGLSPTLEISSASLCLWKPRSVYLMVMSLRFRLSPVLMPLIIAFFTVFSQVKQESGTNNIFLLLSVQFCLSVDYSAQTLFKT